MATEYRLRPHVWVEGGECQKGAERDIDDREASINTACINTTRLSLQEKYLTDFGHYDLDKPPTDEGWAVEETACGSQLESSSYRHISPHTHTMMSSRIATAALRATATRGKATPTCISIRYT